MMIFFDIDDTLIDQRHAEVYGATPFLEHFAQWLPYTPAEFCALWHALIEKHAGAYFRGAISFLEQRRRRMRELFRETDPTLSDTEADARFATYLRHYEQSWRLFDDVLSCLNALTEVPLGIISNGTVEQQTRKLRQTQIAERFMTVMISEELGVTKPAPEIFLEACRRAGVQPQDCVYIGDQVEADARGSRAVGMRGIWLKRDGLSEQRSDVELIPTLAELRMLVTA